MDRRSARVGSDRVHSAEKTPRANRKASLISLDSQAPARESFRSCPVPLIFVPFAILIRSAPASLTATLAALPSMSLVPLAPFCSNLPELKQKETKVAKVQARPGR